MRGTNKFWAALPAVLMLTHRALAAPSVIVERFPDIKLPDIKLPDCDASLNLDTIQDKGKFWYDTGAEQYADQFLTNVYHAGGDHTKWAQELYTRIFPESKQTYFSCINTGALCFASKECKEYNAKGLGGLYYLFISMENFHNWMTAVRGRFDEAVLNTAFQIDSISNDLKLVQGNKPEVNVWAIVAACFSIRAAGLAIIPGAAPLAAATAAVSGVFSIGAALSDAYNKPDQLPDTSAESLGHMMSQVSLKGWAAVDGLVAAVFGYQVDQQKIPQSLRVGGVQNPAVSVFGFGGWLKNSATDGLNNWFEFAKDSLKHALVWQFLANYRGVYVIIRDDLYDAGRCSNPNNAWDATAQRCYDMMIWNQETKDHDGKNRYFGGAPDLEGIWARYDMDKLTVMKNAAQCWENNGGKMGDFEPHDQFAAVDGPPPCFYRITVKKGWFRKGAFITLDGKYPGQPKDGEHWPY